jgi:oxepin-CoA hydrolase/3-oxo-5,6-dehydrosuberyl-CoA semialdehyde dehydrogenase
MKKIENYVLGDWIRGDGDGQTLRNAINGDLIGTATTRGLDYHSILEYARIKGNTALRKMTFHDRGRMLKALALHLREHLDQFYAISYFTGATKADSWIDIEGGIGNLFANASLRRKFPDETYCLDGDPRPIKQAGYIYGPTPIGT